MTDQFDRAQQLEQEFRDRAIAHQLNRPVEKPDIENGIRYCIDCASEIPPKRIEAMPNVVRCVSCQSRKEP
ncbi:TraR/DksA family transcriptional regulator [Vibrio furnissii]|uniref:TraR/DksA family transcriptional regulator n=1 Tax=Vibrio furnissii TaxID=29494 RepID=UPI0025746664|nr:TraR/DksA family transcriptional regulator [Vibrio furnissii]WJG22162.1 TraR/DksA family transcriptional regulator [Vibrio furnissii]